MINEKEIAEQMTGCQGAGDYRDAAERLGYSICEVWDWTSSAGDWTFLVSNDGYEWRFMSQDNNFPRPGFSYSLGDEVFYGTKEEVFKQVAEFLGGF